MKNKKEMRIAELYNQASELASERVEELAREILVEHPKLDEFGMGMGTWSFSDKQGHMYDGDDFICKKLDNFMQKWDSYLHLTGKPMRFTATGPKITNW